MDYTLDQVRCFVAVAEELHFGHAADRLNMTQPPLSRQIQKLEVALEVQLFARTNRSVRLTAGGSAFLEKARRLLALAEEAPTAAHRAAAGQMGHLKLGFTTASSVSALDAFMRSAEQVVPELNVEMHELVTRDQIRWLQEDHLDIALGRPSGIPADIESLLVRTERLMLAVPRQHPLAAAQGPVKADQLRAEPFIMQSADTARYFYDIAMRFAPIDDDQIVHRTSQVLTILALVGAGRGLAFVPESTQQIATPSVKYLPLDHDEDSRIELHALWSPENTNPVVERLLERLRSTGLEQS